MRREENVDFFLKVLDFENNDFRGDIFKVEILAKLMFVNILSTQHQIVRRLYKDYMSLE